MITDHEKIAEAMALNGIDFRRKVYKAMEKHRKKIKHPAHSGTIRIKKVKVKDGMTAHEIQGLLDEQRCEFFEVLFALEVHGRLITMEDQDTYGFIIL